MPAATFLGELRPVHGVIMAVILVVDQITKHLIRVDLVPASGDRVIVTDFFAIVHAWNPGVSFSMFADAGAVMPWLLSAIALAVSLALLLWLRAGADRVTGWALALIIGGALGNVIDRLRFGAVFDFLDFHAAGYHFPAFNVADSAISIGAALLVFKMLFGSPKQVDEPPDAS